MEFSAAIPNKCVVCGIAVFFHQKLCDECEKKYG